jgi:hypothetical protein
MALVSYCAICDELPGECDHAGHRYLDPIAYEDVLDVSGARIGSRVPEGDERERWDNPPARGEGRSALPANDARPVQKLVLELEAFAYLDTQAESLLRSVYELEPQKTTRLVDATIAKVRTKSLNNPEGFLVSRLRQIAERP